MGKVLALMPFVVLLLVGQVTGGAVVWFLKPESGAKAAEAAAHGETPAAPHAEDEKDTPHGFAYPIKDRVVNLADPGARRYLKLSLVLEVDAPTPAAGGHGGGGGSHGGKRTTPPTAKEQAKFAEEFGQFRGPQVQDALTALLSAKRSDELSLAEGRERLREEIKSTLNGVLPKDHQVTRVLLTDLIVQ